MSDSTHEASLPAAPQLERWKGSVGVRVLSLAYWDYTAMRHFAGFVLKLYGGVMDAKALTHAIIHLLQNAVAGGEWQIRD